MRTTVLTCFVVSFLACGAIAGENQKPGAEAELSPTELSGSDPKLPAVQVTDPLVPLVPLAPSSEAAPSKAQTEPHQTASTNEAEQSVLFPTGQPEKKISYSQIFSLQAGPFQPNGITVDNGDYVFQYNGDATNSFLAEGGWAIKVFDLLGSVFLEENFAFSSFSGTAVANDQGVEEKQSLRLNLLGLDTRVMASFDWFPWKSLIPFLDFGYQYTFYNQTGDTDLDSAQGGVGNFVAGAGLRFWINRSAAQTADFAYDLTSIPIFVTAKVNRIFGQSSTVDLDSTSYLAGIGLGL